MKNIQRRFDGRLVKSLHDGYWRHYVHYRVSDLLAPGSNKQKVENVIGFPELKKEVTERQKGYRENI